VTNEVDSGIFFFFLSHPATMLSTFVCVGSSITRLGGRGCDKSATTEQWFQLHPSPILYLTFFFIKSPEMLSVATASERSGMDCRWLAVTMTTMRKRRVGGGVRAAIPPDLVE